ncbi:FAD-dependent oxidoreductase [Leifsonia sp. AG29]|uniref:FAD-dependent oxidoreductase n=1 Tax=Leifsonia sp. AG29 TaxID=2598860 RepID=UPI00131CC8EF
MDRVEVLVVGAGPAGLTTAIELARRGVSVVVVDAAPRGANTSRAAVIHARTLEVLRQSAVTESLVGEGVIVPEFTLRDRDRVLGRVDFSGLPTPFPYTLMLPQSRTEEILRGRLDELGVRVRWGTRASAVVQSETAVRVRLSSAEGDTDVDAAFVVGADGMRSTVREAAGIPFEGAQYPQSFVLGDVQLDWALPRNEVQLFLSPAGLAVVAPLPGGRHRIVATVDEAPDQPDAGFIQALLAVRGPRTGSVRDVVWSSRFRVHHRLASRYRNGRLLLVGDAAHVHSPAGGQGMNTGIQDAVDLAERLTAVFNGSPEASLDDYELRRRPVAAEVVRLTDRTTRVATLRNPAARAIRNGVMSAALEIPRVRRAVAMSLAELR